MQVTWSASWKVFSSDKNRVKSGEFERIWFQKGPRGMHRLLCRLGSGTRTKSRDETR